MDNQQALSLIIRTLRSHFGESLQGIMLYGSRAQGHHRPDSDFDVAVLCDCNIPAYTCWLVAQDIAVSVNRDVDLVDLWQAATVLRKEVVANGRWLYQRDRGQCEEFVASTLSQYQQLNIERREILAATKERLRGGREAVVVDAVRLDKRVVIERCLDRVYEEYRGHEAELLSNLTRQDAIVLNIQRACQACIDMGNHCLVRLKVVTVQDAREVFDLLAARRLISTDLAQSMKKMVGFRNIAVHEYQRLDMNIMKAVIENHLEDLRSLGEVLTEAMGKTP